MTVSKDSEFLNRVLNPQGANGWAIVQASDHSKIWQWCQSQSVGFRNEIEVTPVLTD